jgi:hypothetical protein
LFTLNTSEEPIDSRVIQRVSNSTDLSGWGALQVVSGEGSLVYMHCTNTNFAFVGQGGKPFLYMCRSRNALSTPVPEFTVGAPSLDTGIIGVTSRGSN